MIERHCLLRMATTRHLNTLSDGIASLEDWKMEQNDTIVLSKFTELVDEEYSTESVAAGGFQSMIGGIISLQTVSTAHVLHFESAR